MNMDKIASIVVPYFEKAVIGFEFVSTIFIAVCMIPVLLFLFPFYVIGLVDRRFMRLKSRFRSRLIQFLIDAL